MGGFARGSHGGRGADSPCVGTLLVVTAFQPLRHSEPIKTQTNDQPTLFLEGHPPVNIRSFKHRIGGKQNVIPNMIIMHRENKILTLMHFQKWGHKHFTSTIVGLDPRSHRGTWSLNLAKGILCKGKIGRQL